MTDSQGQAQQACGEAEALLIAAGAGMGVDSGLPDFRGPAGFWRAYPAYERLGMRFEEMANPERFSDDPAIGWGFYGHRRNLYRATEPHEGFTRLVTWSRTLAEGAFVFTSNVDGHFQRAGFEADDVVECHGSILHEQCFRNCCDAIWEAEEGEIPLDEKTMRALEPHPSCPHCQGLARPNILMFGDWSWNPNRTVEQASRYQDWLEKVRGKRVVILEFGAGTGVPTVRDESERRAVELGARLIRVNPRESDVPSGQIGLPLGAREAIEALLPG